MRRAQRLAALARAAPTDIAAPNQVDPQTCTGKGKDRKCLYCVIYEGGKDCFWVKVPEKPKSADGGIGSVTAASRAPAAKKQACRGIGESYQCRYCVATEATSECHWVKLPQQQSSADKHKRPERSQMDSPAKDDDGGR